MEEPERYERKPRCTWLYDPYPEVRFRRSSQTLEQCVYVEGHEGMCKFEKAKVFASSKGRDDD